VFVSGALRSVARQVDPVMLGAPGVLVFLGAMTLGGSSCGAEPSLRSMSSLDWWTRRLPIAADNQEIGQTARHHSQGRPRVKRMGVSSLTLSGGRYRRVTPRRVW
jgi:hypothetical protein